MQKGALVMPELKFLELAEGTALHGSVAYVLLGHFCVYSMIEPPLYGLRPDVHIEIMARIMVREFSNLLFQPEPVFYELQTHKCYPLRLGRGAFEFERALYGDEAVEARGGLPFFPVFCPPGIVNLFRHHIGGKVQRQWVDKETYAQFDKNQLTPPRQTIPWLCKRLKKVNVAAGIDATDKKLVSFGKVGDKAPHWRRFMCVRLLRICRPQKC
jgi:hypothetical protein